MKKFDIVFNQFENKENIKQKIFFDGQIYDAYNLIVKIIKKADDKILIIDNYVDESVLEMLSKKKSKVEAVIMTSDKSNIKKIDIQKFNKQYPTLKVAKTNKFHDRFIIIDNKELYHCGASIKDLGKKCFAMNRKILFSGETTDTFSSAITKLSNKSLHHDSLWQPPLVITAT